MSHSSMILTFVLASLSIAPHTNAATTPAIFTQPPTGESCPVGFSAERRSIPTLKNVRNADAHRGQGLRINFVAIPSATILKASLTVHGASAKLRTVPASFDVAMPDDATETFQLTGTQGSLLHSSIWTRQIVAVNWVELTQLEYADGSTWHTSPESRCTAAPSLMVLVDSAP